MTRKLRYITFIVLALILSTGIYAAIKSRSSNKPLVSSPTPTVMEQSKTVSLAIDYGDDEKTTYKYEFEGEKSAYDALKQISEEEVIPLETKTYDFGIFVQSINELESGTDMAWIYFVNGESGQVAADKYMLQDGDQIEWKYITPSGE